MSYSVRATQRVDYSAQASRQYYAPPSRNTPQARGSSSRNQYSPALSYSQQAHQAPTHPPGSLPFFVAPPGQTGSEANTQALFTTYPSRLRTGVTGLIQPENITGGPKERELFLAELDKELFAPPSAGNTPRDSPAPFGPSRRAVTTTSGRRSRMVSYAEQGSDDDDEEEEEEEESEPEDPGSDPEDGSYGARGDTGGRRQRQRRETHTNTHGDLSKQGRLKKKRDEMDKGWTWLGDRCPGERVRSQRAQNTKHQYLPQEVLEADAQKLEALIPITIDFDVPNPNPDLAGIKIKDRFLWNLNETHITPYQFSAIFCEDTGIPVNPYARTVSDLIDAQIEEAQNASLVNVLDPEVSEEDIEWTDEKTVDDIRDGAYAEEMAVRQWKEADCRIILNIYTHILRDRIEWDLSSSLPPTLFAKHYCTEIGLTGEAIPLVAHAIHEEVLKHKRDCLELELFTSSHPDEQAKWEKTHGGAPRTTNRTGAKGLRGIWRDWWEREEYGPVLVELSMEEMEKREMERTREARRLMRGVTGKRRR